MSNKQTILIQLDSDKHPSVFDRVAATDAGADVVFAYGAVTTDDAEGLTHGGIFTRGPADLKHTAIFIGGSNVAQGEALLKKVTGSFFGPLRVSVMMDANGCNTTAAASVLAAGQHVSLAGSTALVLGGTGPVGQRAARLLAGEGAAVKLASRSLSRATEAAEAVNQASSGDDHQGEVGLVVGVAPADDAAMAEALADVQIVIAAGAAGVKLLSESVWQAASSLKVLIDLNAVPPAGIEGVDVAAKAADLNGVIAYGAIGVGGTKMKIHKRAVASLFESNDKVLDADEVYAIGKAMA